ncbi:MAG: class I tRNA ligase family protein, partial [Bacillota bacterium]|nr:class I tRNA ligase family protein [Bacillota bacterium]
LPTPWNENGLKGCRRYLDKLWRFQEKRSASEAYSPELENLMHRTVKGVGDDLEAMKFNTAIAKLMILANEAASLERITRKDLETLILITYPFAPHMTSELWEAQGYTGDLGTHPWPTYDVAKLADDVIEVVVNVNGKVRDRLMISAAATEDEMKSAALALPKIIEMIGANPIRKVIVVPKKLVNIVL